VRGTVAVVVVQCSSVVVPWSGSGIGCIGVDWIRLGARQRLHMGAREPANSLLAFATNPVVVVTLDEQNHVALLEGELVVALTDKVGDCNQERALEDERQRPRFVLARLAIGYRQQRDR